jgi:membrane associated rhomboid family serine protease
MMDAIEIKIHDAVLEPKQRITRVMVVAPAISVVFLTVFAFMAGGGNVGPSIFLSMPTLTFDVPYLRLWGARYLPHDFDNGWRWFTCTLVHMSFRHMIVNFALTLIMGVAFESMEGTLRTLVVVVSSAAGGSFFSAVTESPCLVFLGGSGITFGFAGALIVASIRHALRKHPPPVNFISTWWFIVGSLVFFTIGMFIDPIISAPSMVSNMTHVGGLLSGQAVTALMYMPRGDKRWKVIQIMAATCIVGVFVVSPAVIYTSVLEEARVCD